MNIIDRITAKTRINQFASNRIPFIVIINFEVDEIYVERLSTLNSVNILYDFKGKTNFTVQSAITEIQLQSYPESFAVYYEKFAKVKEALNEGDTYLLNLTSKTRVKTHSSLQNIFFAAKAKYKLWVEDKFAVFSPETFIEIKDNKIFTYPMKGTINAAIPDAEKVILDNLKETAEQVTIVDLLRNDLSIVSRNARVHRFRFIDKIITREKEIIQVSSEIAGDLTADYRQHLGDILFSLLPAGSISGAPKKRTVELIREIEGIERGFYTGICGIFDGENFDSCVLIRFIEKTQSGLFFRSGGGITHLSNAEEEYKEMIEKIYVPVT